MRIAKLEYRPYQRPFRTPLKTARGSWQARTGVVFRATLEDGSLRYAESAPLPEFGTETVAQIVEMCARSFGRKSNDHPCHAFALDCLHGDILGDAASGGLPLLPPAVLLPPGEEAEAIITRTAAGHPDPRRLRFKLKIGSGSGTGADIAHALLLINRSPAGARFRLDANESLDEAAWRAWSTALADVRDRIEFIEQPFPRDALDHTVSEMRAAGFPLALDEAAASRAQIEALQAIAWPGQVILKPAIHPDLADLAKAALHFQRRCVISSVFETGIGFASVVRLASRLAPDGVHGLGTPAFFPDDGLNPFAADPNRALAPIPPEVLEAIWEALTDFPMASDDPRPRVIEDIDSEFLVPDCSLRRLTTDREDALVRSIRQQWSVPADFLIPPNHLTESQRSVIPGTWRDEVSTRESQQPDHEALLSVPLIGIATGGTTGRLRFALHDRTTVAAAVESMRRFFDVERIHGLCTVPLDHISGLMQLLRADLTGARFVRCPWKTLEAGRYPAGDWSGFFLSLVPTQLGRLLRAPESMPFLRQFRAILLGGARADESLLERARAADLPLAPCYGMTETAAFIAAIPPARFLDGNGRWATPLPGVRVRVLDEESGRTRAPGEPGRLAIRSPALFRQYFPWQETGNPHDGEFLTGDEGMVDAEGRVQVLRRLDRLINTGGEKVDPEAIESILQTLPGIAGARVMGEPDPDWGERIVADVMAATADLRDTDILRELRARLPLHAIPKEIRIHREPDSLRPKSDRFLE